MVLLDEIEVPIKATINVYSSPEEIKKYTDWPKKCERCDYQFQEGDNSQIFPERLYTRTDNLAVKPFTLREAPIGAMWDAYWSHFKGPDGISLQVKTPGGEWAVDGPSTTSAKGWQRTGTIPRITAKPSILFEKNNPPYHGWLTNGELIPC